MSPQRGAEKPVGANKARPYRPDPRRPSSAVLVPPSAMAEAFG